MTDFFKVTLPLVAPGIIAGALFAFATLFDEVVVTLFLASPEQSTLPRQMFSGIRDNISPTIAAVATVLIVVATLMLLVLEWMRRRNERLCTASEHDAESSSRPATRPCFPQPLEIVAPRHDQLTQR